MPTQAGTAVQAVEHAIATRRSVRGFRPDPVPRPLIERLLSVAARAPSGSNIQPWRLLVLTGEPLARFGAALTAQVQAGVQDQPDYRYYPAEWREPYIGRRRQLGWSLYSLAGIAKGDRAAAAAQALRNFSFFGAPVGIICTIDRDMGDGSLIDCGMFLENIMVAARGHGLDTCPQAAFVNYPNVIRGLLGLPADQRVVCGMALGWADPAEPTNALETGREPVEAFATFRV